MLDMRVEYFSLAGYLKRFIVLTGGKTGNEEYSNIATMLDTLTGSLQELPSLIHARRSHSSIALDKHLYAIGGLADGEFCRWIEFLDLENKHAWQNLLLQDENVSRAHAAVTWLSSDQLVVFGGLNANGSKRKDGYIVKVLDKQVTSILGKGADSKFNCHTQTQWVGGRRHITLGVDDDQYIYLEQLNFIKESFQELRSIEKLGHRFKTNEQLHQEQQQRMQKEQQRKQE